MEKKQKGRDSTMNENYLYEKLAKNSEEKLRKEINDKMGYFDNIDGQTIYTSKDAITKIKTLFETNCNYLYYSSIINILKDDAVENSKAHRLKLDIDSFLKDVAEIKDKLNDLCPTPKRDCWGAED